MTDISRTAYPRFTRAPSVKELRTMFTPTLTDVVFVATHARRPAQKFALMILLKVYQRLQYFPDLHTISGAVISHIRSVMQYPPELVPDIASATLYRYLPLLHRHSESSGHEEPRQRDSPHSRHIAARAMHTAAQVMESPADLINAAIQTLLLEHCELPAFSTLDRIAWRIRRSVNAGIYQNAGADWRQRPRQHQMFVAAVQTWRFPSPDARVPYN